MGVARSPAQAHSLERTFNAQIALAENVQMAAEITLCYVVLSF